ncbi:response regulator transcription factor [Mitsuaria sp. BK037]|uniref:response regulator n=1 Tax=Mitsuaria sp. BK037 TaxID=2587122 RepID=UPI001622C272|nr:response regulator transcription factor [Mitsuaria sp. BK037]MBB3280391.1 DNA-binding NarL/FixJ family response regulator [Mitsuaria sp. BK037]
MRTRLMVIARHQLLREALASLIQEQGGQELVAQAGDGQEAVRLAVRLRPEVVLMDMELPGLNCVDTTQRIVAASPSTRVLCLADEEPPHRMRAALDAGASGILAKDSGVDELVRAIGALGRRQFYLSPSLTEAAVIACAHPAAAPSAFVRLTPKEREIVQLLAEGLSTKHIAAQLGVSQKTVASHREHAVNKLGLRGLADITRYAIREGLARP